MNFLDARLPPRFWDKVAPCPMSGCWLWTAALDGHGYGQIRADGKNRLAHRFAYVAAFGEHASGLELDHLCRTPLCSNPLHLEPVSHRENMMRGRTVGAANAAMTTCAHGHPFDGVNSYTNKRGIRVCRLCRQRRLKELSGRLTPEQRAARAAYKAAWKARKKNAHRAP